MSKAPKNQASHLLTLIDDSTLHSHGFIHFYGNRKPWTKNINLASTFVTAQTHWLQAYNKLESNSPSIVLYHQLPLTEVGYKKYHRVLQSGYGYSLSPSEMPSVVPSASPSSSPTLTPSEVPSAVPSASPSGSPTLTPSELPSVVPSVSPSGSPTLTPSELPSVVPSASPSGSATLSPSPSHLPLAAHP